MDLKILIRFDDICPTMDFPQFNRAVELMDKYNVKPLIGVIPLCKDKDLLIEEEHEDFWEYVKSLQEKGYTVAMHGYEHVFCSPHHGIVNRRIGSEFAGLPFDMQLKRIQKGKAILESHGIKTEIFFAPAHSYDMNTLKALSQCGFRYMSDGKSRKPYFVEGVKCLPCRSGGMPKIKGSGYYTAVFHAHEWRRADKAYGFDDLNKVLSLYSNDIVSFNDYCEQPAGSVLFQRIDEYLYVIWQNDIRTFLSKVYQSLKRHFTSL